MPPMNHGLLHATCKYAACESGTITDVCLVLSFGHVYAPVYTLVMLESHLRTTTSCCYCMLLLSITPTILMSNSTYAE